MLGEPMAPGEANASENKLLIQVTPGMGTLCAVHALTLDSNSINKVVRVVFFVSSVDSWRGLEDARERGSPEIFRIFVGG